jgi:hypothetical protein
LGLAVDAVRRVDAFTGWLTIIVWMFIGGTVAGAWWQGIPWWVPTGAFTVFFAYGFLKAVYEEHVTVDSERQRLETDNREFQERASAFRQISWVERENEQLKGRNERLEAENDKLKKGDQERVRRFRVVYSFMERYRQERDALEEENKQLKGWKDTT